MNEGEESTGCEEGLVDRHEKLVLIIPAVDLAGRQAPDNSCKVSSVPRASGDVRAGEKKTLGDRGSHSRDNPSTSFERNCV